MNGNEILFNDTNLIRTINTYKSYDQKIAEACLSKHFYCI